MIKKGQNHTSLLYTLYESNLAKIIFVVLLHVVITVFVNLPYINIFTSLIGFLPFIIDWIAITILFKPSPRLIFRIGVGALLFSFPFLLIHVAIVAEILGNLAYLMFATYIILTIGSIKKN